MSRASFRCAGVRFSLLLFCFFVAVLPVWAADAPAKVYVVLWFDTEDYILPASDDAAAEATLVRV